MNHQATFYFADPRVESPAYFLSTPPDNAAARAPGRIPHQATVSDVRGSEDHLRLDEQGVIFVKHQAPAIDFYDSAQVEADYYPQVQRLVQEQTGCSEVFVFDHNVRNKALVNDDFEVNRVAVQNPVKSVHNDYTEVSGPQRVRDFLPERAEELINGRFAMINVWRPISGPVRQTPFAVIDADSIEFDDFIPIDLVYSDRIGQIYMVKHNASHRWIYMSEMNTDDVMLLKCFDSSTEINARYTAHSAFEIPRDDQGQELPERESIEVRTLVFFRD